MVKHVKIVVVGDSGVGKSSLIQRLKNRGCPSNHNATYGVDVSTLKYNVNYTNGTTELAIVNVWDCAGDNRYGGLRDQYYTSAQGAIVMFDATNPQSSNNLQQWVTEVSNMINNQNFVIAQNKVDLLQSVASPPPIASQFKYCGNLSVKAAVNCDEPMRMVLGSILNDDHLSI